VRAGALTVGHLLECSGQLTGGNFEPPGGGGLDAASLADLGFPLARLMPDGSAEITVLDGAPAWLDPMTCTLQLLYEVHDPARYITPDGILDFTAIRFEQLAPNRVRMAGARLDGRPDRLKVIGFVERNGLIADVEIGFAGTGALDRARRAADTLRLRLPDWPARDLRIDLVGVDSILGAASAPLRAALPELRLHISARCPGADAAQLVEDEVYALTLSGPAGGAGVRSERRAQVETITGFLPRAMVPWSVETEIAG
jgi:Acyclic terpene utilisation family protein AtuA